MHDLIAITSLGGQAPRVDQVGAIALTEVCDTALASVAQRLSHPRAASDLVAKWCGHEAPAPGTSTPSGTISAFWMGPEQWMLEAPFDSHEDLEAQLFAEAKDTVSITEQSDAWCRFDLTGPDLARAFALLCPIDMRSWTGGNATRTSIDHLGCLVISRAADDISVYGPRSSAGSLHHALHTALRSIS